MTRNAANGKKVAEVRLGASTIFFNESEVELVASQRCSQSAADPLHQAKTAEGSDLSESDDSYPIWI